MLSARRLLVPAIVMLGLFAGCAAQDSSEKAAQAAAESLKGLEAKKQTLDQKRAELGDLASQMAAAPVEAAAEPPADGSAPPATQAELQAKKDALEKEIAELSSAFVSELVQWINDSGIVEGQELTAEQKQAFRWKTGEDMAIASEHIEKGGDYQRALDIYHQALSLDPDNEDLKAAIARAEQMRYPTEERFAEVKKKMSMDEVKAILGPVYLRNVQKYDEKGVTAWFYRKQEGGAAGVYFQESKKGNGDWRVYNTDWAVPQGGGAG